MTELHVEESGGDQRETVVFLHGGNVSSVMWAPQRDDLAELHQLLPDMPGFGESNEVPWQSIDDTADELAQLIRDRAHDGRAHLVGISLGAAVGLAIIARHPEVVRRAALTGTPVRGLGSFMRWLSYVQLRLWKFTAFWSVLGRHYRVPDADLETFVEAGIGIDPASARTVVGEVNRGLEPLLDGLGDARAEILALAGGGESRTVRDGLADFARIPGAHLRLVPGLHHLWNVENPALFGDVLRLWLVEGGVHDDLEEVSPAVERRARRARRAGRATE